MNSVVTRIKAVREAGDVKRCHAMPSHTHYTIASHCYGAVNLLLLLNPDPSVNLIKALMWHDVAERWLGDLPSPGKMADTDFAAAYERVEQSILEKLELAPDLSENEKMWLKAMDLADLFLWAITEHHQFSNWAAVPMMVAARNSLNRLMLDVDPLKQGESMYALIEGINLLLTTQNWGEFHDRLSDYMWTSKS